MLKWSQCIDNEHVWENDTICHFRENCVICGLVRFCDKGYNRSDYLSYYHHYRTELSKGSCEKYQELYKSFCAHTEKKRLYSSNLEIFYKFVQQLFPS